MKAPLLICGLCLSLGAFGQTADNSSQSSSTTSAVGNQQSINFITPQVSRSEQVIENNVSGTSRGIVEYSGSYTLKNVPSVNGGNLTTSNDTCMGSSSGSANGPGFGLSFGTTWTDEHCKRLKMSRELWNKGMKAASMAMDCMDESARIALEITGTKCPQSMTADERKTVFGPSASDFGAPAYAGGPPTGGIAVASPVKANEPSVVDATQTAGLYNN